MTLRKRKNNSRILKYAGIAIGVICVVFIALIMFLKTDYARSKISATLSDKLGREFAIDGPVNVKWDWKRPYIQAQKIRIANTAGSIPDHMLEIDELNVSIKIWKLLAFRLELPSIDIVRPHIYLEKKDATTNNWDFPALSGANTVKNAALPDSRRNMPLIGNIRIVEGKLNYKDIPRNIDMTLDIDMAKGRDIKKEGFTFFGSGTLEDRKFDIKAESGSLNLLRDTNNDFPLSLSLNIGDTKFSIDGTFKDPVQLKGLNAMLHLSGSNLADIYYLTHIPLPPTPAYKLDGRLTKDSDKWTFENFEGRVGGSDLSGTVAYNAEGERPALSGNLYSNKLDVADLGGFVGVKTDGAPPKTKDKKSVLPDVPIDLTRLRAGDLDLDFEAKKLNAPGWPLSDMKTHISLKDGLLTFDPLGFGLASGTVNGHLTMDGREDIPKVDMDLKVNKMSLSRFFQSEKMKEMTKGAINGRIQLTGNGHSLARVLGNSNGRVVFLMTGGKVSLLIVEAADIDIAQLTPLLFGKDKTTDIRCAIGDFNVTDGLLKSQSFIFDTTDTNIKGDVKINMKDEKLNASLDARPKDQSLLALQSKIILTGTMGDPTVMIDPLSTGLRGAAAAVLGAVTPLAAILPFVELGHGEDSDCNGLIPPSPKKEKTDKVKVSPY